MEIVVVVDTELLLDLIDGVTVPLGGVASLLWLGPATALLEERLIPEVERIEPDPQEVERRFEVELGVKALALSLEMVGYSRGRRGRLRAEFKLEAVE